MSEILSNLWLGSIDVIHDYEFLAENHITHVLTVLDFDIMTVQMVTLDIKQMYVNLYDCDTAPIGDHFERCVAFIREALSGGGNVYVHCFAGISRSPSMVAAYLIAENGMSASGALDFIKARRPIIDPNDGFRTALEKFAASKTPQQ